MFTKIIGMPCSLSCVFDESLLSWFLVKFLIYLFKENNEPILCRLNISSMCHTRSRRQQDAYLYRLIRIRGKQ